MPRADQPELTFGRPRAADTLTAMKSRIAMTLVTPLTCQSVKSHWPVFLERWRRMVAVEPNYTRSQMAGITIPTLIIVADRDHVTPEHAVEMFRIIPAAKLCVVPGAGHGVLPTETVLAFLKQPAEPAATQS